MPVRVECCPAFNYARNPHKTSIILDDSVPDTASSVPTSPEASTGYIQGGRASRQQGHHEREREPQKKVLFESDGLSLDLRYVAECAADDPGAPLTPNMKTRAPVVELKKLDLKSKGHLGEGACCDLVLEEGQAVTFVLRTPPENGPPAAARPSKAQAREIGVPIQGAMRCLMCAGDLND